MKKEILIISSVSGGGKTTIIREILKRHPERFHLAITATTRKPRHKEIHGKDYYFISEEEFQNYIKEEKFIEFAKVHQNYYGVPIFELENAKKQNRVLILNIDYQGMRTVKKKFSSKTLSIFLMPPSEEVWLKRLRSRNTESEEEIQIRIQEGKKEIEAAKEYDYIVINDDLEICLQEIQSILKKEFILNES
ncbi:MAG: guanylate kinase [Leptospiraceae bacterium]|nr:guanylate kinase [Leptospiraceae bacterium]MDW7975957.1 guanylate kinase [Leptospiraceae bacterium]